MTLYLCTKMVTISSRGAPNLSNFLFERQQGCISVGCISSAAVVVSGGGICPGGMFALGVSA